MTLYGIDKIDISLLRNPIPAKVGIQEVMSSGFRVGHGMVRLFSLFMVVQTSGIV